MLIEDAPERALVEQPPVSGSASTACGSPSEPGHDHDARRLAARHAAPAADSRRSSVRSARRSWRRRCARSTARTTSQHPFHQLMYEGKLSPAAVPGLGGQPAGLSARGAAQGRGDPLQLPRSRGAARVDPADHRPRRHGAGHRRHRAVDPARRRARRAAGGDGGRAARAAGRAAHLRVVRHVLQDASRGRRPAPRRSPSCSRPRSTSSGSRRFPGTIRGSRPRRSTTSRAGWCRRRAT